MVATGAHAATLRSRHSGLAMEVWTTEPGLQVYDGFKLDTPVAGLGARLRDADRLGVGDAVCGGPVGGLPLGDGGVREAGAASSGRRREDDAVAGHRQHGGDVLCGQPAGESTEKPDEDGDEGDHGADEDESAAGEAEVAKSDEHEGPFWSPVLVTLPLSPLLPGASSAVCTPFQGRTMACRILLSDDAR